MPGYTYIGCCVDLPGEFVTDMVDQSIQVTYRTLREHVGGEAVDAHWPDRCPHISTDWHVQFHRSKYRGLRCYYVVHSAIEHIFVRRDQ